MKLGITFKPQIKKINIAIDLYISIYKVPKTKWLHYFDINLLPMFEIDKDGGYLTFNLAFLLFRCEILFYRNKV